MAVFGLYLTNIPKVLNFSTKMPWKINQQIFFYTCWWNQHTNQGLLQKEKLDINGEKSAEISILVQKTVTKRWLKIRIHISYTLQLLLFFFSLLCSYCVTEIIKKLELHLLVSKILILNLDMPKSVCSKLVHQCRKQPVRTLAHRSTFFCLVNVSCIFMISTH